MTEEKISDWIKWTMLGSSALLAIIYVWLFFTNSGVMMSTLIAGILCLVHKGMDGKW